MKIPEMSLIPCFLLLLQLLQQEPLFPAVSGFVMRQPPAPYRSVVVVSPTRLYSSSSTSISEAIGSTSSSSSASTTDHAVIATTEEEAAVAVLPPPDALTLWRRRLITHEDPFGIHKIAALVYTGSAAIILGTGAIRFVAAPHEIFAEIPSSLETPALAFVISNVVMCLASVRMAFLHRKFDLTARNAFLGTAVSSLFSGFYFLWTSPFAPDILNTSPMINQGCFGILVLLNVIFIMDTLLKVPEVVESRRDRKAEAAATEAAAAEGGNDGDGDYDVGRFVADAVGYVLPIAWGMPVVASTGYIASVLHDRPWFVDQCAYIDDVTGQPGLNASICYLQVMASLAASYGSLFVTLRDKKLITKQQELAGITAFSVPAMIWTIYVSAVFFIHLFDAH